MNKNNYKYLITKNDVLGEIIKEGYEFSTDKNDNNIYLDIRNNGDTIKTMNNLLAAINKSISMTVFNGTQCCERLDKYEMSDYLELCKALREPTRKDMHKEFYVSAPYEYNYYSTYYYKLKLNLNGHVETIIIEKVSCIKTLDPLTEALVRTTKQGEIKYE